MTTRILLLGVLVGSAACTTEIPSVDFTQLACTDNAPLGDGLLPCPASHHCVDAQCTPRLNCTRPGEQDGCIREVQRCEASLQDLTASVACQSGLYAVTSTKAPDPVACNCPAASDSDDLRLLCVAVAGAPTGGAYPLFVLPEGGALPSNALGVPAEIPDWRWCSIPCSSDVSCPVDHTCRPAAVVSDNLLAAQSTGRQSLSVCYPNRLYVPTSSAAEAPLEPDPDICMSDANCDQSSGAQACQVQVEPVPDHPYFPLGEAWKDQRAFFGRCVDKGRLTPFGMGCVEGSDATCVSGICNSTTCARNCDPDVNVDGLCACRPVDVVRQVDEAAVLDSVHLCAQR